MKIQLISQRQEKASQVHIYVLETSFSVSETEYLQIDPYKALLYCSALMMGAERSFYSSNSSVGCLVVKSLAVISA